MKHFYYNLLPFTILFISVSSVLQWCTLPIGNTAMWWCIQALVILCFFKLKPPYYKIWTIKLFLILLCLSAVYGAVFMAENYWDWKLLISNLMVFSMPLAAYVFANPTFLAKTLKVWFKYAWIILLVLSPFLYSDAFGRFLVPYSFLSLFLMLMNRKYWFLIILAYIITITLGVQNRSDLIKFSITILLGLCSFFNYTNIFKTTIKVSSILLFVAPVVFFILGVSGSFNIFKLEEELGLEDKYKLKSEVNEIEYSALQDTRTFLYVEEISSALKYDYVLQGRSIARGYESEFFGPSIDEAAGLQRGERGACETSILNIFNYFGIIGVVSYFLIFFGASYYAIFKSRNRFVPIVGLAVAFRWVYAWVEDFSRFDLNMLMLFVMIGICYSPFFRNLDNKEFKYWINSIIR